MTFVYVPLLILSMASQGVVMSVRDSQQPRGYATEADCKARLAQLVAGVMQIKTFLPAGSKLEITQAACPKR